MGGLPPAPDRGFAGGLASLALAAALSLAACGSSGTSAPSSTVPAVGPAGPGASRSASAPASPSPASGAPSASAPAAAVTPAPSLASPVTGVVISVDSAGLAQVTGFTLRLPGGAVQAFRIGVLENGAEFPPGHLKEHVVSAAPVRVFFRPEGSDLVVYRIEDAG